MGEKRNGLYWILLGLLGIFLIIAHNTALDIIFKVIGLAIIISSIYGLVDFYKFRDNTARLIGCIIGLIVGLWIFGNTWEFITFVNVVLGVILIVSGGVCLYRGFRRNSSDMRLIYPCISILIGIIIATSHAATSWVTIGAGIGIVYSAIVGYVGARRY